MKAVKVPEYVLSNPLCLLALISLLREEVSPEVYDQIEREWHVMVAQTEVLMNPEVTH